MAKQEREKIQRTTKHKVTVWHHAEGGWWDDVIEKGGGGGGRELPGAGQHWTDDTEGH